MANNAISRRKFLKIVGTTSAAAISQVALGPLGSAHLAFASGPLNRNLIVVEQGGGCCYTQTPGLIGEWLDKYPTVYPANPLVISSDQALHPSYVNVKQMYDLGQVALVNMVGNPAHNRSHDEATLINQTGYAGMGMGGGLGSGWGGRLANVLGSNGVFSLAGANDWAEGGPAKTVENLGNLGERSFSQDSAFFIEQRNKVLGLSTPAKSSNEQFVFNSYLSLESSLAALKNIDKISVGVTFPNTGLGGAFEDAAKLIISGIGANIFYIRTGGYDTHTNQDLSGLLNPLDAAIAAFKQAMELNGKWNDTVVVTTTEFARTFENPGNGTDHGFCYPQLIIGGSVKGGQKTAPPVASDFTSAYFNRYEVDYREVWSQIVGQFLGIDPGPIFPEAYTEGKVNLGLF